MRLMNQEILKSLDDQPTFKAFSSDNGVYTENQDSSADHAYLGIAFQQMNFTCRFSCYDKICSNVRFCPNDSTPVTCYIELEATCCNSNLPDDQRLHQRPELALKDVGRSLRICFLKCAERQMQDANEETLYASWFCIHPPSLSPRTNNRQNSN